MNFAVVATALLATIILLLGFALLLRPAIFKVIAGYFVNPTGIWIAAGIRIFSAAMLWLAGPATRFPGLFKVLAVIALIAGVGVLIAGHQRVRRIVDWSLSLSQWALRGYAVVAVAVGAFVLWALFD